MSIMRWPLTWPRAAPCSPFKAARPIAVWHFTLCITASIQLVLCFVCLCHTVAITITAVVTEQSKQSKSTFNEYESPYIKGTQPLHRVRKSALYFRLLLLQLLVECYNFYTTGNRNEYSTITCNLLTYWFDDVITVRHRTSWKFSSL